MPPRPPSRSTPKVSCLMVTANRRDLCRRAVRCYERQTYPHRELIVVDDGTQDLAPVLASLPDEEVTYIKLSDTPKRSLGALRNIALDAASGTYVAQWDDDDWYHPDRLARQTEVLQQGFDACCLRASLMHIASSEFMDHPYIGYLKDGVPGTIVHRSNPDIRYPKLQRAEDTAYLNAWKQKKYTMLPPSEAHLFIRCFHGANTWSKQHFKTRIRNTVSDALAYVWYRFIRGNLYEHPRFQLDQNAQAAFEMYLRDSRELGLMEGARPTCA